MACRVYLPNPVLGHQRCLMLKATTTYYVFAIKVKTLSANTTSNPILSDFMHISLFVLWNSLSEAGTRVPTSEFETD